PKLVPIVLQMAFFFVFPMVLAPTLLPLGVEQIVEWLASVQGLPIFLGLSLLECIAVVCLYRLVLSWEGELLHIREQKILEIVTTKAECRAGERTRRDLRKFFVPASSFFTMAARRLDP